MSSFLACVVLAVSLSAEEKKAVPLYTNEDLDRVAPFRDQTGVNSRPAPAPSVPAGRSEPKDAGRTESYWRHEADRVRIRLLPLRERLAELEDRIAERERLPGVRLSDPRIRAWQKVRLALENRIRDEESRLEDRARREGALPGWLR